MFHIQIRFYPCPVKFQHFSHPLPMDWQEPETIFPIVHRIFHNNGHRWAAPHRIAFRFNQIGQRWTTTWCDGGGNHSIIIIVLPYRIEMDRLVEWLANEMRWKYSGQTINIFNRLQFYDYYCMQRSIRNCKEETRKKKEAENDFQSSYNMNIEHACVQWI